MQILYSPHYPLTSWLILRSARCTNPILPSSNYDGNTQDLETTAQACSNTTLNIPLSALTPLIAQISLTALINKGITHLHNLYIGNSLKTFSVLQKEFNLPQNDIYQYPQIRHCLLQISYNHQTIQTSARSFLTSPIVIQKINALFYNILQQKCTFIKSSPINNGKRI